MNKRDEKLAQIISWAEENKDIRALLLTSSLVNPLAPVDDFSDLDIELVFEDNEIYIADASWLSLFGKPIALLEEDESRFEGVHAMKMVLYDDHVKVDFKLFSIRKFLMEVASDELPQDWDIGFKVLIDKDGLTQRMKPPTHTVSIIKKPDEKRFSELIQDFWWDTTYVAKSLARGDIFYAKFMSENIIRTEYLVPLIEWFIAVDNNWGVTTNKQGRLFKKYLPPDIWSQVEQTFSGSDSDDNWRALFVMADLVNHLGGDVAGKLNYSYPLDIEHSIRQYLLQVKELNSTKDE